MGFLPNLGLAAVLLVGGLQVIHGHTSVGHLTAFYAYVVLLSGPVRWLGMSLSMAQRAVASGNRMFEILDREPSMESPPGAPPLPDGRGQVSLQRVTLRYDGAEPALTGIDLEVDPGRTIALVGPTGAGKTSLVGLLARLYDPSEGRVVIDGADIRDVDLASLRSEIAFVADDSFLFSDTVAGNIAYARPDATQEQIEAAARRAQAHDFISRLPDGYDTVIGERGLTLSGGQRQRVAIARALLAEPRILILDDATSSVDARTEAQIKDGLREAMEGRTTFIVAHRLSTISLADEIVVMDRGPDRRPRHPRRPARALPAVRGDRREGSRGLRLPPAGPGRARGAGQAMSDRDRKLREAEERAQEEALIAEEREEETYQAPDSRFRAVLMLFGSLWRLIRGEDNRWRKVRWLFSLLRPYRRQVLLMFVRADPRHGGDAGTAVPGREGGSGRPERRLHGARADHRGLPACRSGRLGHLLPADLPGRMGRRACAPGPAHPDLHPPPGDVDRVLHA